MRDTRNKGYKQVGITIYYGLLVLLFTSSCYSPKTPSTEFEKFQATLLERKLLRCVIADTLAVNHYQRIIVQLNKRISREIDALEEEKFEEILSKEEFEEWKNFLAQIPSLDTLNSGSIFKVELVDPQGKFKIQARLESPLKYYNSIDNFFWSWDISSPYEGTHPLVIMVTSNSRKQDKLSPVKFEVFKRWIHVKED